MGNLDLALSAIEDTKDFSLSATATSGINYMGGFYEAPAAEANLDEGGTSVVLGTANIAYGAHAFLVSGGPGSVNSGSCLIRCSGEAVDDQGGSGPDTEDIVPDITAMTLNEYFETTKKWTGQVTFTLIPSGATVFNADFNYGLAKYDDFWNVDFTLVYFEAIGKGGFNDNTPNIEIFLHSSDDWTYSPAAFVPGGTVIADMATDYGANIKIGSGLSIAWKRDNLTQFINGSHQEGFIIAVTISNNNSIRYLDAHVKVRFEQ